MKREAVHHWKTQVLKQTLDVPLCYAVGYLEMLWQFTAHNAADGDLSKFTPTVIAAWMEYPGDPDTLIDAFVQARYLDRDPEGRLTVHHWAHHAPRYVQLRLQRAHSVRTTSDNGAQRPTTQDHDHDHDHDPTQPFGFHGGVDQKDSGVVVEAATIAPLAAEIWSATGYGGKEGGNLWKIAALRYAGQITEDELWSACRGAKLNGRNKAAHCYTCLDSALEKRGLDLKEMMRRVRITPTWPKTRPKVRSVNAQVKTAPADESEASRRKQLDDLERNGEA